MQNYTDQLHNHDEKPQASKTILTLRHNVENFIYGQPDISCYNFHLAL